MKKVPYLLLYLFGVDPFSEGKQKQFWQLVSLPEVVFPLYWKNSWKQQFLHSDHCVVELHKNG